MDHTVYRVKVDWTSSDHLLGESCWFTVSLTDFVCVVLDSVVLTDEFFFLLENHFLFCGSTGALE